MESMTIQFKNDTEGKLWMLRCSHILWKPEEVSTKGGGATGAGRGKHAKGAAAKGPSEAGGLPAVLPAASSTPDTHFGHSF
jgi:hypothetical protein